MARVTGEDCVEKVTNRFELVMVASQRSREISAGAEPRVEIDRDKNPVVALREIAEDKASPEELYNSLVQSLQRHVEVDEPEEDGFDAMASNPEFNEIRNNTEETESPRPKLRDLYEDQPGSDELTLTTPSVASPAMQTNITPEPSLDSLAEPLPATPFEPPPASPVEPPSASPAEPPSASPAEPPPASPAEPPPASTAEPPPASTAEPPAASPVGPPPVSPFEPPPASPVDQTTITTDEPPIAAPVEQTTISHEGFEEDEDRG